MAGFRPDSVDRPKPRTYSFGMVRTVDKKTHTQQIADRIRAAMDEHGLSARELARRAGVSPPTVSRLLRGNRAPSSYTASRLLKAIGGEIEHSPVSKAKPTKAVDTSENERVARRVAKSIKIAMQSKGFSLHELARRTGEDPATISRGVNAVRCPSVATLLRISKALNVPINDLVNA